MERRNWTTEEKLAVVLEGLRRTRGVVDLCREHGITQEQYFSWRDRFVAGGRRALSNANPAAAAPEEMHRLVEAVETQTAAVKQLAGALRQQSSTNA